MNQVDLKAETCTGVQIDVTGKKLWVCVDGACVLRVKTPEIVLTDDRKIPEPFERLLRIVDILDELCTALKGIERKIPC